MKLAFVFMLFAACATVPPTPAQITPQVVPPARIPEGQGVMIVDVTDGPTRVEFRRASCTSPCALTLPLGSQPLQLRFRDEHGAEHIDTTQPLVLPEPHVLRRTLHRSVLVHPVRHRFALALYYGGYAALAAAAIVWGFVSDSDGVRATSWGLAGAGGGMLGLSFPLDIGATHRVAGAETQFPWRRP
jgi:hypothetical protein